MPMRPFHYTTIVGNVMPRLAVASECDPIEIDLNAPLNQPYIVEKIRGFRYGTWTTNILITTIAKALVSGCYVIWFQPEMSVSSAAKAYRHTGVIWDLPHAVIDISQESSVAVNFKVPFLCRDEAYNMLEQTPIKHKLYIAAMTEFRDDTSSAAPEFNVYMWIDNIRLMVPTNSTRQIGKRVRRELRSGEQEIDRLRDEVRVAGDNAYNEEHKIDMTPQMETSSTTESSKGSVDAVRITEDTGQGTFSMETRPTESIAPTSETSDPKIPTAGTRPIIPNSAIKEIGEVKHWIARIDNPQTKGLLKKIMISPLTSLEGSKNLYMTNMQAYAMSTGKWRCDSATVIVQAITNAFVDCQYILKFEPTDTTVVNTYGKNFTKVISLKKQRDIVKDATEWEFEIPWCMITPWQLTTAYMNETVQLGPESILGYFTIEQLNAVQAPADYNNIDFLIWLKFKNLQLHDPSVNINFGAVTEGEAGSSTTLNLSITPDIDNIVLKSSIRTGVYYISMRSAHVNVLGGYLKIYISTDKKRVVFLNEHEFGDGCYVIEVPYDTWETIHVEGQWTGEVTLSIIQRGQWLEHFTYYHKDGTVEDSQFPAIRKVYGNLLKYQHVWDTSPQEFPFTRQYHWLMQWDVTPKETGHAWEITDKTPGHEQTLDLLVTETAPHDSLENKFQLVRLDRETAAPEWGTGSVECTYDDPGNSLKVFQYEFGPVHWYDPLESKIQMSPQGFKSFIHDITSEDASVGDVITSTVDLAQHMIPEIASLFTRATTKKVTTRLLYDVHVASTFRGNSSSPHNLTMFELVKSQFAYRRGGVTIRLIMGSQTTGGYANAAYITRAAILPETATTGMYVNGVYVDTDIRSWSRVDGIQNPQKEFHLPYSALQRRLSCTDYTPVGQITYVLKTSDVTIFIIAGDDYEMSAPIGTPVCHIRSHNNPTLVRNKNQDSINKMKRSPVYTKFFAAR